MSGNHNQSFKQALSIVDAAKRCGASALKLQTYKPETITLDSNKSEFIVNSENKLWNGKSLHNLYKLAYTDWDWVSEIMKYSKKIGIDCFSSVFDETSVEFLENLNVCAYKIASFENNHIP